MVAKLTVDLSSVPKKEFKVKRGRAGCRYYRLDYEVEISIQTCLEFSLSVNGKKYGSVSANYD